MHSRSAPALLLDVTDLQERDRIVAFLTAEHGKKRGVARGARAKYSRFAGHLQPLSTAQVSWFEKPGRELVRVSSVETVRPATALQGDLEGILIGCYLADHMLELAQENEASGRLYRLLDTTIAALLQGVDRHLAVRYFEVWMLRLAGVFPVPRVCPLCGAPFAERAALIEAEGALVCPSCAGGARLEVGPELLDFLRRTGRESLDQLRHHPPEAALLDRAEELCGRVRRHFLQRELRSYVVMQQTLASVAAP